MLFIVISFLYITVDWLGKLFFFFFYIFIIYNVLNFVNQDNFYLLLNEIIDESLPIIPFFDFIILKKLKII